MVRSLARGGRSSSPVSTVLSVSVSLPSLLSRASSCVPWSLSVCGGFSRPRVPATVAEGGLKDEEGEEENEDGLIVCGGRGLVELGRNEGWKGERRGNDADAPESRRNEVFWNGISVCDDEMFCASESTELFAVFAGGDCWICVGGCMFGTGVTEGSFLFISV